MLKPGCIQRSSLFFLSLLAGFVIFLLTLAEVFFIPDSTQGNIATSLTSLIVGLITAITLFFASRQSKRFSRRLFWVWGIFGAAYLCNAIGELSWLLRGMYVVNLASSVSLFDAFYVFFYPFFLVAILLLPRNQSNRGEETGKMLDMAMVMIASALIFWNFLISPLQLSSSGGSFLLQLFSQIFPISDLLLLWGVYLLLFDRANQRNLFPLTFVALSGVVMIITDYFFYIQSINTFSSGSALIDTGYILSSIIAAFAGISQIITVQQEAGERKPLLQSLIPYHLIVLIETYMPYLWLVGAFLLLIESNIRPMPMPFKGIGIGVGALIFLAIIRQVLVISENRRLFQQLSGTMARVQNQASELTRINQDLTNEVTIRRHAEERLSYDALHDGLTGLPNRTLFSERLSQALNYHTMLADYTFSVLFLDLDHFKIINDSLGHTIGDQLLVAVSHRLRACLRASDTVARLGGDEFVILLENSVDHEVAITIAKRILESLRVPLSLHGHDVFTTASIGIVMDTEGYQSPEEILRDADIAMYRAKILGKSRYEIFTLELRNEAINRLRIENELRSAIEKQEFILFYQPIYSVPENRVIGFEALIRWNHPKHGLQLPAEFLKVAEETGLILQIGKWVLHQACSDLARWQNEFPAFPQLSINVNISSKQFKQPDFVNQVQQALADTGVEAGALNLEITESLVIENPTLVNDCFNRLSRLGVQLQVDDFGTGYSSLSYLHNFPSIKSIKIDRSFIQEVGKAGKNADLVRTMIMMAQDLGMKAIAEGVETEEQLNSLKGLTCQFAQGFYMARPMNYQSIVQLLENNPVLHP